MKLSRYTESAMVLAILAASSFVTSVPFTPNVNGVPIRSDGMSETSGLLKSKSSSDLLFLFASVSVSMTGNSSPEFHSASAAAISTLANPNPTTMLLPALL